jgi:hypothetical protein
MFGGVCLILYVNSLYVSRCFFVVVQYSWNVLWRILSCSHSSISFYYFILLCGFLFFVFSFPYIVLFLLLLFSIYLSFLSVSFILYFFISKYLFLIMILGDVHFIYFLIWYGCSHSIYEVYPILSRWYSRNVYIRSRYNVYLDL